MTPFLAADNKTLFFATNGREGLGSFDIFYAERLNDTWQIWSDPINLGSKINTSGAEKSFSFMDATPVAYYTSNTNSDGYGDIRSIRINSELKYSKKTLEKPQIFALTLSQKVILLLDSEDEKMVEGSFDIKTDSLTLRVANPFIWKAKRFSDLELSVSIEAVSYTHLTLPTIYSV